MSGKSLLILSAVLAAIGVAIGAFGAHALPNYLGKQGLEVAAIAKREANLNTGVRYQMYHTLAILAIGILQVQTGTRTGTASCYAFLLGIAFFSGGLYIWSLTSNSMAVMVVPIGGLCFITGWVLFAISLARSK
ncbi:MAG: DUF423 domain-containing protein [Planctomycetaceae bacterium]|nr:DUF423 domain-containing protein [Planctomycetaceae bacterium]